MGSFFVNSLTEEAAKRLLSYLIDALDEEDEDDFFGTEGWRRRYDLESEIPGG